MCWSWSSRPAVCDNARTRPHTPASGPVRPKFCDLMMDRDIRLLRESREMQLFGNAAVVQAIQIS